MINRLYHKRPVFSSMNRSVQVIEPCGLCLQTPTGGDNLPQTPVVFFYKLKTTADLNHLTELL